MTKDGDLDLQQYSQQKEFRMSELHGDIKYKNGPQSSSVFMDHYSFPRDNAAAYDEVRAFAGGGKAPVPRVGARLKSGDLTAVVNHTFDPRSGETGGDLWLEHRGRRKQTPPFLSGDTRKHLFEVRPPDDNAHFLLFSSPCFSQQGRSTGLPFVSLVSHLPPLSPLAPRQVVNQTADHGKDGVFGSKPPDVLTGDRWLEARGKRGASGGCLPAVSKGRKDLYEVLQQKAPVLDGRTTGDLWLEQGATMGRRSGPPPPPRDARWDEIDYARAKAKGEKILLLAPKNEWQGPK